jgi:hypothetical protein
LQEGLPKILVALLISILGGIPIEKFLIEINEIDNPLIYRN